jgi:hypothetical protein
VLRVVPRGVAVDPVASIGEHSDATWVGATLAAA